MTTASSAAVDKVYALAKSKLPVALEAKLSEFPSAIINTHGRDLTVSADPSRTGTPTPAASSASTTATASTPAPAATPAVKKPAKAVNTAKISVDAHFMASADDLFSILTDEKRIPSWTRAPAQVSYFVIRLVSCLVISFAFVVRCQTGYRVLPVRWWCLWQVRLVDTRERGCSDLGPQEPVLAVWYVDIKDAARRESDATCKGHTATMTTTFEQSSDSTKVTWSLAGVPLGMEDELTHNIQGY